MAAAPCALGADPLGGGGLPQPGLHGWQLFTRGEFENDWTATLASFRSQTEGRLVTSPRTAIW